MTVPKGLKRSGRELWRGVETGRTLDAPAKAMLLNACRIADRLDELAAAVGDQLTVTNKMGDEVANPLITEHRQQLGVLRQVLAQLGVGKLPAVSTGRKSILDEIAEKRAARAKAAGQ